MMLDLFQEASFETKVLDVRRWPELPTPRHKLVAPYSDLPHEELVILGFDVVLH
jgi:hypothetical protein